MAVELVAASSIVFPKIPMGGPRRPDIPLAEKVTVDLSEWATELTNYAFGMSEYNDGLVHTLYMHPDTLPLLGTLMGNLVFRESKTKYCLWSSEICFDSKMKVGVISTKLSDENYDYDCEEATVAPSGLKIKGAK
jgi:hypothetical protein